MSKFFAIASVFAASVLLASCGGGSGDNSISTNYEPDRPPETGPLTATGSGGDGQGSESENEQEQQIIVVNQEEEIIDIIIEQPEEEESEEEEEQQIIVVNIQPEPEEESEEEKQQQQLTIIEEEDIPYVEQEEEEPGFLPATQAANNGLNIPDGLNIGEAIPDKDRVTTTLKGKFPAGIIGGGGFPYGLEASERFIDNKIRFLTLSTFLSPKYRPGHYTPHKHENPNASEFPNVRYKREDGFKGIYIYEGETGELTGDVDLLVLFGDTISVFGNILTDFEIEEKPLPGITMSAMPIDPNTGVGGNTGQRTQTAKFRFGKYNFDTDIVTKAAMNDPGQAKLTMVLSPDVRLARGAAGGGTVTTTSLSFFDCWWSRDKRI